MSVAAITKGLASLATHPNFILVKLVPNRTKPGKLDKFPCDWRTGQVVDAHNPEIWMPWEQASMLLPAWGQGYCLGWVITPATGVWCLDVDNCVTPEGQWSDTAARLFALLPRAAAEVSLSRKGLHFWGTGPVPPHGKKCTALGLELYTELRMVALTCEVLQGDASADHTAEIASLVASCFPPPAAMQSAPDSGPSPEWRGPADDAELLRRAMRSGGAAAAFGGKASFADLWTANVPALARCYPDSGERPYDASSADAALAQHLAFWTGRDAARIERLMRRSALARDKWEREDYMHRTIAGACGRQVQVLQDTEPATVATADAAWLQIHMLPAADLSAAWLPLAQALTPAEASTLVGMVALRLGAGRRELNAQLRDARAAAAAERAAAAVRNRAAGRAQIEHRPEDRTAQAAEVEALILASAEPGSYLQFAGRLARIATKALPHSHMVDAPDSEPPSVPQIEMIDRTAALGQAERVAVLYEVQRSGRQKAIAMPDRLIEVLLEKADHLAPNVSGLVLHPVVLHDGVILTEPGLHAGSGLYLQCEGDASARAYSQAESAAALARVHRVLLQGFEFASPLDAWVAVAGLFTGVQRRVLDIAPGLAVVASVQSSGKTTLARRIHALLTGRDMPASTFPLGDGAEIQKQLLSALLSNPAMVCFDNVPDGFTFRSGVLAGAMTASRMKQRILGASRDVDCPTNTLFVLTGNNIDLGADEVSRWLVCRLAPKAARPEERTFSNPDVLAHAVAVRAEMLRDVVGIVAGYLVHGGRSVPAASRFQQWDAMVRQPLMWAGGADVARVFRENAEESEAMQSHVSLLHYLRAKFSETEFAAHQVAHEALVSESLRATLERIRAGDATSARSVGHTLNRAIGRVAVFEGREWALHKRKDGAGPGAFGYRVAAPRPTIGG